ncbi:MAG: DUF4258 domain-containing protein [bacterium]|nr:DUF4258 domain-containing protein [bacterium]
MKCKYIKYSGHAINQMFKRQISKDEVSYVVDYGEVIKEYPDDKPYPSRLLMGYKNKRPLHVVLAFDNNSETCYIITAYVPDFKLWTEDFKKRR